MPLETIERNPSKQRTKEEKLAICSGSAPLPMEDRIELLTIFASDVDSFVAERAQNVLLTQAEGHFVAALARADADHHLFGYCADHLAEKPGIADALAKNAACPGSYVARAAKYLTSEGISSLLDNLERFTTDPELIEAVAACPAVNPDQRAMLDDMQKGALSAAEIEEAAEQIEPDPVKRQTLLQKVARMNVIQRLTLALKGGRTERMLLIRDSNKLVQRCVLQSPRLTDSEAEAFAAMTNLSTEVLRTISLMRIFVKNYAIVRNLVNNPKTPLDVSLHLFPRLTATDLAKLTTNKNVPDTLRSSALKLHRKRKAGSAGGG
jgi:hypothetical protein